VRPGTRKPGHGPTEPLWALAPSEAGAGSSEWSKWRESLACNANPAKAEGGVAGGRLQAILVTVVRHAPGPWRQKASWSSEMRFPSRGGAGMRILVGSKRAKGTPTLRKLRTDDHGVLEAPSRRGIFIHLVMRRRMRGEGRSFARGVSAHVKALSSPQPAVAASDDWIDTPSASGVPRSGGPRSFNLAACLQRRVVSSVGLCVTHCPPPSREGGSRTSCDFERGGTRSEGERVDQVGETPNGMRAVRIGRSLGVLARH